MRSCRAQQIASRVGKRLRSRIWCDHPNCLNKRARSANVPGFCKSTTLKEVCKHGHALKLTRMTVSRSRRRWRDSPPIGESSRLKPRI